MKETLKTLIEEFREILPTTADSIPREVEFPEVPKMINVAIGMRRTGKTYTLYQKIRELVDKEGISLDQILFINFEDDRLLPMNQKELGQLLDTFYTLYPKNHDQLCYLFLDEIQNIEGWPLVVRRFYDSKKVKIFLSGSSAKLLSVEIATSLRGRSISTEIWPFSFHEYWKAHEIDFPTAPIGKKKKDLFEEHLREYFHTGGFPAVQHLHENERHTILQNYVNTVVFRDIIERHKITNTTLIKYLIKTLLNNISSPFSVTKFYKDIKSQGYKVGKDTLFQYLGYIEDAFLVFSVSLFSESQRKVQTNPKKIYAIDNGLISAYNLGTSPNWGPLFENQLYLDFRRQGKKIYYYLTEEGYEIDFLVKNLDGSMELIQAVWDISDPKTLAREERALEAAKKELGIEGRIVSMEDYLMDQMNAGSQT